MTRKLRSEDQYTDQRPEPRAGLVYVTFDAGTNGLSVDTNPQAPVLAKDKKIFYIDWVLQAKNTFSEWFVDFGNVIPCDPRSLPEGYEFRSDPIDPQPGSGQVKWRWTFTPKTEIALISEGRILYDILCTYRPNPIEPIGPPSGGEPFHVRSLRESVGVDPTIVLPPKESGPGLPGED